MNMHFVYLFFADGHLSRGEYSGPCKEGGQSPRGGGEGAVRAEQRVDWGVMTGEGQEGTGGWRGRKADPPHSPRRGAARGPLRSHRSYRSHGLSFSPEELSMRVLLRMIRG